MNRLFFVCLFLLGIVGKAFSDNEVFREKEITICSGNFQLPGTLTLPLAGSHFPIVVLVHGSGPSDRDETFGPNKPFRDIAHGLAAKGIAVLRYEKRTKVYGAKSFPNDSVIIDAETTDDALAAIDLASTFKEVDAKRLYVVGHSLGGMLAPRIAERSRKPLSGIILLAANARSLEDLILEQTAYLASLSPLSGLANAQMEEMKKRIINIKKLGTVDFDRSILSPFNIPLSYWQSLHEYDQVKVAKSLHIPMLVLQGERDYQVTMTDFELWRSALSGKKKVQFKSYPALNHLLQVGSGKSTPQEYSQVNPVDSSLIQDMATFIHKGSVSFAK